MASGIVGPVKDNADHYLVTVRVDKPVKRTLKMDDKDKPVLDELGAQVFNAEIQEYAGSQVMEVGVQVLRNQQQAEEKVEVAAAPAPVVENLPAPVVMEKSL